MAFRPSQLRRRDDALVNHPAESVENLLRKVFLRGIVDQTLEFINTVSALKFTVYDS